MNQARHGIFELGGIVEVAPFQNAAQQVDAVLARRLGQIQVAAGLFVHGGKGKVCLRRQGDSHRDGLAFGAGILLQVLFGEAVEQALHLAGERDQGIPGAVDGKIVAAGINDADLAPELGHGTDHFEFAGEKLLVEHGKRHVLFDGMDAAQAESEIIHVAAQHAPDGAALGAARESLHGGGLLAIVAGRGVAGQHDAVGREIGSDAPGMLAFSGDHLAGILRRPADARGFAHFGAELAGEILVGIVAGLGDVGLERGGADLPQRAHWSCPAVPH